MNKCDKYDIWQHFSKYRDGKEARALCLLCNTDIRGQARVIQRHIETTCPKGSEVLELIEKHTENQKKQKLLEISTGITSSSSTTLELFHDVNRTSDIQNPSAESSTMAQYFQIVQNVDELKRLYPNLNLENVQVVSVAGEDGINQQVLITQDDALILNEQAQQVVYQQSQQQHHQQLQSQQTPTHYILQQDDDLQQAQVFYSTSDIAMDTDQIIQQHQINQAQQSQQQVVLQQISPVRHQTTQQQQILVQKTAGSNSGQILSTQVLMQQPTTAQSNSHQRILLQQTPHVVIQQQNIQQTSQGHQQSQHVVMRHNLPQQRIVYTQPRTVVFQNNQQQQRQHLQQSQQHQLQHQIQNQVQQVVQDIQTLTGQRQTNSPQRIPQQRQQAIVTPIQQQGQIQQPNVIFQHMNQSSQPSSPQSQQQQRQQAQTQHVERGITNQTLNHSHQPSSHLQNVQENVSTREIQCVRAQPPNMNRVHITQISPNVRATARQTIRFSNPTNINSNNHNPTQTLTVQSTAVRGTRSNLVGNPTGRGRGVRANIRQSIPAKTIIQQVASQQNQTVTITRQDVSQAVQSPISGQQYQLVQQQKQPQTCNNNTNASGQKIVVSQSQSTTATTTGSQQHRITTNVVQKPVISTTVQRQQDTSNSDSVGGSQSRPVVNSQTKFRVLPPNTVGKVFQGNSLDIEESIQAVLVPKNSEAVPVSGNSLSVLTTSTTTEPKTFDTTLTSYYSDNTDEDKKTNKLINGRVMNLTEYKKLQKQDQSNKILSTTRSANAVPVNRVAPMMANASTSKTTITQASSTGAGIVRNSVSSTQQQIIQQQNRSQQFQLQETDGQKSARMLVILKTGEQRLITFTLPRESCTVQELLEQVGVPFTSKTNIQVVSNPGANIDYVVTVGISVQESTSDLISAGVAASSVAVSTQNQQMDIKPEQSTPQSPTESVKEIPAKLIHGFLALCPNCGYTGYNHAKCDRCHKIFTEEPKRVQCSNKPTPKSDDERKRIFQQQLNTTHNVQTELINRGESKATLAVIASHSQGGRGLSSVRGKGRSAARTNTRPTEAEPVVLTLSSDDEADDVKSNKSISKISTIETTVAQLSPLPCEPIISESDYSYQCNEREHVWEAKTSNTSLCAILTCKMIRIGTHAFEPKHEVIFTPKGMRIIAPSCNDSSDVILDIQLAELIKVVFNRALPVLFIYTKPKCAVYIRECLGMKSKSLGTESPYYNPTDRVETSKRIVLQPIVITEDAKNVIRSIFSTAVLEEISLNDASELLIRSCTKDKLVKSEPDIRQILIYPQGKGGMPINTEDYMCLAIDQYLNDVIIDFYLKYLHLNVLSDEQREKTHIFSSFFYKRLTTMSSRQKQAEKDAKLTPAQKRHARVKSWTKSVNLFEKDFIIIPINEQSHWFLAIICYPKLKGPVTFDTNIPVVAQPVLKKKKIGSEQKISLQIGNTTITPLSKREFEAINDDTMSERDEAEGDESDLASDESDTDSVCAEEKSLEQICIKQPLILIFDSLSGASRSRVVATLRDYLTCEYRVKIKEDSTHTFNKMNMPGHCVKVPQQNNFTDCGLYLLQYVEHFFREPIRDYRLPIRQLINWFETIVVTRKREEISNLLRNLVEENNPDILPLPEITFPTINGKLIEQDESFNEAEFEEEDIDEEVEEEEDDTGFENEIDISPEKFQQNGGRKKIIKRSLEEIGRVYDSTIRKNARVEHTL